MVSPMVSHSLSPFHRPGPAHERVPFMFRVDLPLHLTSPINSLTDVEMCFLGDIQISHHSAMRLFGITALTLPSLTSLPQSARL